MACFIFSTHESLAHGTLFASSIISLVGLIPMVMDVASGSIFLSVKIKHRHAKEFPECVMQCNVNGGKGYPGRFGK